MQADAEIHSQSTGPSSGSPDEEREEGLYEPGAVGGMTGKPTESANLSLWDLTNSEPTVSMELT